MLRPVAPSPHPVVSNAGYAWRSVHPTHPVRSRVIRFRRRAGVPQAGPHGVPPSSGGTLDHAGGPNVPSTRCAADSHPELRETLQNHPRITVPAEPIMSRRGVADLPGAVHLLLAAAASPRRLEGRAS